MNSNRMQAIAGTLIRVPQPAICALAQLQSHRCWQGPQGDRTVEFQPSHRLTQRRRMEAAAKADERTLAQ